VAGSAASAAQSIFFRLTSFIAPAPTEGAFQPPEPEQENETALQTVARRLVEGFAQRGPLTDPEKKFTANLVHHAFGALWGGLYGLIRESSPRSQSLTGTTLYSTFVWMMSDNLLLPGVKLAAWPKHYPLKTHAYAWLAHLVYGLALAEVYDALSEIAVKEVGLNEVDNAISHLKDLKTILQEAEEEAA
jgi:hypothetical protein